MTLIEELKIFLKNILHWIYAFFGFSFFFFIFGPKEVSFLGREYLLLLPTENSFSVQVFNKIRSDLIPPDVLIIVTNPMSAFVSQILLSIMLSFLLTIPIFLYKFILYLQPALLPHERKVVLWSLLPFVLLFFAGSAFAYLFLIPATFNVLYPYATTLGVVPFFSLDEFVYYVSSLMIGVGVMFLLPIFMILLSYVEIIKYEFWIKMWRYALLFFLVLSAIITPDGTGITMIMLFLPLTLLYFLGCFFSKKLSNRQ